MTAARETITLAAGCFWCVEAVFRRLKGVERVVSGYCGGRSENPTYREICAGGTGHAEAVQVTFDPGVISLSDILEVFWRTHDPTTLNRQGADVGDQYRSAIFYHDEGQRALAEESRKRAEESRLWPAPIVTLIEPAGAFYPAEEYHRDYYELNRSASYCRLVIDPKIARLQKVFGEKLKAQERA